MKEAEQPTPPIYIYLYSHLIRFNPFFIKVLNPLWIGLAHYIFLDREITLFFLFLFINDTVYYEQIQCVVLETCCFYHVFVVFAFYFFHVIYLFSAPSGPVQNLTAKQEGVNIYLSWRNVRAPEQRGFIKGYNVVYSHEGRDERNVVISGK